MKPKHLSLVFLVLAYAFLGIALSGCVAKFPIGENGRYGTALIGYELPSDFPDIIATQPKLIQDK